MKTRTGWMGGLIAMTVLALSVAANAQAEPEEWDVEWWSGETETNPYTNAAGVVWGIYEGETLYDTAAGVTNNWSSYKPMTWTNLQWEASANLYYTGWKKTLDGRFTAPGALTFDPPANFKTSGRFSLYGAPVLRSNYTELWIGILDGSDNFTELYYIALGGSIPNASSLGTVEALQNLRLRTGERIAFIVHKTIWDGGNRSRVQFDTTDLSGDTVGISWEYVPPKGTVLYIR